MNIQNAYNNWADQYDTNQNKTRDMEAKVLRTTLGEIDFDTCLEIGCGTGKNTEWLLTKAKQVTAVDFSEEMLSKAKQKITSDKVKFVQADILKDWFFAEKKFDLVTFSLVLEHIENLDYIFENVARALVPGGCVYIGELHPFKQYSGSKARFETKEGQQIVTCFTHHISEFIRAAKKHGLEIVDVNEYFDLETKNEIPRVLALLFKNT
jgi:ubiquinone/menaquinone biosynthesis C-methylase UbiE